MTTILRKIQKPVNVVRSPRSHFTIKGLNIQWYP